jgi:salicylate hydroxylase
LIFSKEHARVVGQNVRLGLELYEKVRKERASIVQAASLRARADMRERFGWSSASDQPGKLTLEWLCEYNMVKHVQQVVADVRERGDAV